MKLTELRPGVTITLRGGTNAQVIKSNIGFIDTDAKFNPSYDLQLLNDPYSTVSLKAYRDDMSHLNDCSLDIMYIESLNGEILWERPEFTLFDLRNSDVVEYSDGSRGYLVPSQLSALRHTRLAIGIDKYKNINTTNYNLDLTSKNHSLDIVKVFRGDLKSFHDIETISSVIWERK